MFGDHSRKSPPRRRRRKASLASPVMMAILSGSVRASLSPRPLAAPRLIDAGVGVDQLFRVGMDGSIEDLVSGARLDEIAAIHHPDAVRDHLDHRQAVTDEQEGQAIAITQIHDQVQDLRLIRYVEGG